MPTYKALLFDLFHTLIDVATAPGTGGRYTADILGLSRDAWNHRCFSEHHEICCPTDHLDVVRRLAHSLDPSIEEARIVEATSERQRRFDHALAHVEERSLQTLRRLRQQGYALALVSNASSGEVSNWPNSPLADCFDTVVFSCESGVKKPQPAIYRLALQRLGVSPSQALFVGDGGSDEHRGAAAVGIDGVLLTHYIGHLEGERMAEREAAARWRIDTIEELFGLPGMGQQ